MLGGDGTMLRALARFLGTGVPVIGVNYGRVGFLTAITADGLEDGLARVFAGDYRTVELATLEVTSAARRSVAVNDVVVAGGDARPHGRARRTRSAARSSACSRATA